MGSVPLNTFKSIQQLLTEDPEDILWTSSHKVCVLKGVTGKLGIKVKVFQGQSSLETYTIVTKVKEECYLLRGHILTEYERIISINDIDIRNYAEDCVLRLLQANDAVIELKVCRIDLKRGRESNGSDTSEMSGRPPLMKFKPVKPVSVDRGCESDQLVCPESGISIPDSHFPRQFVEEERNISVPVLNSPNEIITSSEHFPSMELPRKAKRSTETSKLSPGTVETYVKYPHCVKWSPTKTITLNRGNKPNFGFKFKIKKCVYRQDDWYTLVVEVKDVPAEGTLMIGDYIRSINGQALATPQEAFRMMESLEHSTSVRIVLQRPEGLIPNFKGKITQSKEPYATKVPTGSSTVCEPVDRKPKRQNSSTSTGSGKLFPTEQSAIHPSKPETGKTLSKTRQPDNNTLVSGLFNVVRPGSSCSNSNESHMNLHTDQKLVDNSEVHLIVPEPPILNNNNQVLSELQTNRTVKLPKIRIFICGNEARTLAKLLIPISFMKTDSNSGHNLYECVKCTMDMSKAGDVSFMSWSSYDNLLQSEETTRLHASNDSLSNGEIVYQREEDSYLHRGVVNTEIFIVPDEKFFQHCCQYLFTRTSLFLLTFSGAKVLNSAAGEILRLQNMIHSIRCCVGYDCSILTYGLLGKEQAELGSSFKDEVKTLFYTSYGQQIQKYNVTIPDLILPSLEESLNLSSSKKLKQNVWKAVSETMQKQHVSILSVVMMRQLEDLRQDGKQVITEEEFSKLFKMAIPNGEPSLQHVVWTHLKEFGEILSLKAAPLNLPNNQHMEQLLFIDPEIIVQHIQWLICIPQRHSFNSDVVKQIWFKLITTGNISKEDILFIIGSQSINGERILKLLLAFGLIFQHFVDQDGVEQFFFPYFLSDQGTLESQRIESGDACLYLQLLDQTHMSSMQFYQLAFSLNNNSDSKKISLTSAVSCTLHHLGHEINLIHHKFEDRMQIIVSKSERNRKLSCIYQWFADICNSALAPEIQYILGPQCPLHDACEVKESTNNMHVVEFSSGSSIFCKTTRIDNHKDVKRWLQDQGAESCEQKSKVYIKDLPYSIFHKLFTYLQLPTTLGQDWRSLGGLMGLSIQEIAIYETQKDPAKSLLLDQDQTQRLTVHELIDYLNHPDMNRKDLIEPLQNWLDGKK